MARFPDGFLWGAATSAYQIEGSPLADGAGPSIWQRFSHTPGLMHRTATPATSPATTTIAIETTSLSMRELGLSAYRFSISWSRILPEGTGRVNQSGARFLPPARRRAARKRASRRWHALPLGPARGARRPRRMAQPRHRRLVRRLRDVMFDALDDRVKFWATLNEPWVVTDGGYLHGALAPGHRNLFEAPIASAQPAARARRGRAGLPRASAGTRSASSSTSSRSTRRRDSAEDIAATAAPTPT